MNEKRKVRVAVLREDLLAITGDYREAIILKQYMYWTEILDETDRQIEVENEIAKKRGGHIKAFRDGWIYKKSQDMADEIMLGISASRVRRYTKSLVDKGFLLSRQNPKHKWDKILHYKVNFDAINKSLKKQGYPPLEYVDRGMEIAKNSIVRERTVECSPTHNQSCADAQALPENTTDITFTKDKRVYKASFSEKKDVHSHDKEKLRGQVLSYCEKHGIDNADEIAKIINYFIGCFERERKEQHKHIPQNRIGKIIHAIDRGFCDIHGEQITYCGYDEYKDMIEQYFTIKTYKGKNGKPCDYRIYHFMDDEIRCRLFEQVKAG